MQRLNRVNVLFNIRKDILQMVSLCIQKNGSQFTNPSPAEHIILPQNTLKRTHDIDSRGCHRCEIDAVSLYTPVVATKVMKI